MPLALSLSSFTSLFYGLIPFPLLPPKSIILAIRISQTPQSHLRSHKSELSTVWTAQLRYHCLSASLATFITKFMISYIQRH